ncbi:MAG: formate dehydrogenase subunit gamma [Gammaproteobacteria bacterium]|nr:formate dehydrogenase subunit gamma [Gammaproteobacteria bacterium]
MWISKVHDLKATLFLLAILTFGLALPVGAEPPPPPESPIAVPNPASDLWRAVRQRSPMPHSVTQVEGVDTAQMINTSGETFRQYRRQDFVGAAGWLLVGVPVAILLFYVIRGRIRIPGGRSGRVIERFPDYDRTIHWFTALLFIFLALTGLTLLFGRFVILPLFGPEAFSVIASASKEGHNLFGPLFPLAVLLLFIRWAVRNLPAGRDLVWLFKGGGIIGNAHVSAGFFNAGEKIWFWSVIVLGIVVSVSGLILVFPVFGQGRDIMQLALVVHGIATVVFIAFSFGHIYIGTIGSEGSFEGMKNGYVDEAWAKTHHDLWYEQVKAGKPIDMAVPRDVPELHEDEHPGVASTEKA